MKVPFPVFTYGIAFIQIKIKNKAGTDKLKFKISCGIKREDQKKNVAVKSFTVI